MRMAPAVSAGDFFRSGDGYYWAMTQSQWLCWQAAWNAAQPKPPAANTVRVRIPVAVNAQGHWYARRWANESDEEAIEGMRIYAEVDGMLPGVVSWITADVPKPEIAEVRGEVGA